MVRLKVNLIFYSFLFYVYVYTIFGLKKKIGKKNIEYIEK